MFKFVRAATGVVAVSTFVLLYYGLVDLARIAGVNGHMSWLYPLAIDGAVAVGYAATLILKGSGQKFAWSVVGVFSAVSFAGQYLHAQRSSDWVFAGAVQAVPALSMAAVWHLLYLTLERVSENDAVSAATAPVEATPSPAITVPAMAAVAAVKPRPAVVVSTVRKGRAQAASDELLKRAIAILSTAHATGERMTGRLMAERLELPNADTESGVRAGTRYVARAREAISA